MPRIEESIDIAAGPGDVFRFCHDAAHRPDWDSQVQRVELLTSPPMRQGTLLRVDAKPAGGAVFSWDAEVIVFQFPRVSRLRVIDAAASSPFAPGSEVTWEFNSAGGSTRLTWIWEYRPRGIVARLLDGLGGRASTQRAIRHSLHTLKGLIEGGRRARLERA